MSLISDLGDSALCLKSENNVLWLSSDLDVMREAAHLCGKCPVKMECLYNAIYCDDFIGVRGGMTEYEYLSKTWVRVTEIEESNWPRTHSIIHRLLREYT